MTAFVRKLARRVCARDLATAISASVVEGEPARLVGGIGSLAADEPDLLSFCDASNATERLALAPAGVVIVATELASHARADQTFIHVDDVRAAFIDLVEHLLPGSARPADPRPGIGASARIDPTASVAESACIGDDVTIGARTRVAPGAVVYADSRIGDDCVIGPNAVIGWVGLAYHDRRDGRRAFFPHLAGVRIGNGVDVGAHACVCRGMLSHTTIGDAAKIGSLVYVSHGVVVEARAWLSAATAVAGHASIAANALLGIGSVIIDNVAIHEGVLVGGGSVVTRDAAAGSKLYGVPARHVPRMRRFGPTPRE
ncbi:MAG TPA: DapH/DapD/GlmU-related protein [Casimicrobiaceae bacterium]|nr:DapH/DapD/GlmU-related protein [Casimicrobiaceae bacterium]